MIFRARHGIIDKALVSASDSVSEQKSESTDTAMLFTEMTFTQCTSMSELKFDSGAPSGGQIYQYVSFSALFKSLTKVRVYNEKFNIA